MKKLYSIMIGTSLTAVVFSDAAMITWDGGPDGTGTNWNEAVNWMGDVTPGSDDTAVFTDAGLVANKVIVLGGAQIADAIELDATVNFTIGNTAGNTAGHTLTLSNISRTDMASGTQTLIADLILRSNAVWHVNGSGVLILNKITGEYSMDKDGAAELRLNGSTSSRTGATMVSSGVLSVSDQKQLGTGPLVVGNGVDAATFQVRWGNNWNIDVLGNSAVITVKNNGIFDLETYYTAAGERTDSVGSFVVEAGGLAKLGKWGVLMGSLTDTNVIFKGGSVVGTGGYLSPVSGTVLLDAAATEKAVVSGRIKVSYKYSNGSVFTKFNVCDVAALPVELEMSGELANVWDDRDGFDKLGAGVMRVTASNTYGGNSTSMGMTRVQAGTLLVDNTSGSGTGKSVVYVSGGAMLGGTGMIGGVMNSPNANVIATGSVAGSVTNLAIIAPGSLNDETGAHVIGTLTVGGANQTNNVTFGGNSKLVVTLDTEGHADRLVVNGTLSLATTGDMLEIRNAGEGPLRAGTYPLVTFQQLAAEGQVFDTVVDVPSDGKIVYTATAINYVVPSKGTVVCLF